MPDQRTATVHFGANRIATGFIECISNHLGKVLLSTSTKTITRHEYVEHFRATMVASDKLGLLQGAVEPLLKDNKALDAFKHIIISEHALLGPVSDMLTKKTMFPKAKRRAQNLDNAFSDRQLHLHLAIAPQAESWTYLLADDDISPGPSDRAVPVHSWADLVSRITAACPRATLTVWNFEQPHQVMLPFLAALLDIDVELVDPQTRKALSQEACHHLKSAKLLSKIVQIDEELQIRMDAQYELDLIRIAAMSKVTLRDG
ncbi:hypothetical protein [Sulfitobacter sp. 916]|uniref:hypothetical protein n=1 Tax=Sulfitobacter sp. 916 TaxID=3368559 RepID=UPI0037485A68